MCPRHALAIVCFGIILTPGWGHGGVWTSLPPDGAAIGSIVIDAANPATLYAAGLGLAYKSTDGAANWAPGASIGDGYSEAGLLADPSDPSRLYAFLGGSPGHPGGIFTSMDGAATWTAISNDLGDCRGPKAIAPASPSTWYAGCGRWVFKSTDSGAHWTAVYTESEYDVVALAIDPTNSDVVYAGFGADGIRKTTDGGTTWNVVSYPGSVVYGLTIDPSTPSTLYAAPGLYKSIDGGVSWAASDTGLTTTEVSAIVIDASTPNPLYAITADGVFKSVDGAASWGALGALPPGMVAVTLVIDPAIPSTLYCAGESGEVGVVKSTDGGTSWTIANKGMRGSFFHDVIVHPTDPTTLYVLARDLALLLKSTDAGATWATVDVGSAFSPLINPYSHIAFEPGNPSTLYYAGANDGDVLKSTDAGASWISLGFSNQFLHPSAQVIAVDPVLTSTIHVGTQYGPWRTTTGGASWSSDSSGVGFGLDIRGIAVDPLNRNVVFATTYPYQDILRSTDGGDSWADYRQSPSDPTLWNSGQDVVIDPVHAGTVYVGVDTGVLKTTDDANSGFVWKHQGLPDRASGWATALALDPYDSRVVYLGTGSTSAAVGAYASRDGADTWNAIDAGLPPFPRVLALAADPSTPGRLYAATRGHGLFVYNAVCGDGVLDTGEDCDDGNTVGGDCCSSVCQFETGSGCSPTPTSTTTTTLPQYHCAGAPEAGCGQPVEAGKASLMLKNKVDDLDQLVWKWNNGAATAAADFGDPVTTDHYAFCLYDESSTPTLLYEMKFRIPSPFHWKGLGKPPLSKGVKYTSGDGIPDGIVKMSLKPGVAGKAKIVVNGKGPLLPFVPGPAVVPVPLRVQLQAENGHCWEARYTGPSVNDGELFRAKSE